MGSNVNLSDVLKKIASDTGFLSSAGENFKQGETLEVLFISGGTNKADSLVLKDSSGDNYTISAQSLQGYLSDAEYEALMNGNVNSTPDETVAASATQVQLTGEVAQDVPTVDEVGDVDGVTQTEATAATQTSEQIQKEIDALEVQRQANQQSMQVLQEQIEDLKGKIETSISDALAKMEEIEEEQKKEAEEIVANELAKYQNSNGEMTQDEFNANVQNALAALNPSLGEAIVSIMSANNDMALMSNLLGQLSQKVEIDKQLGSQIDAKEAECEAAKAAEEAAKQAEESKSCDPIGANFGDSLGFDLDGDGDAGQIQIDFFYDEDGDGKINSMDDFVGAKSDAAGGDGWDEMSAMDADGDGTITGDELADKDVKVMITEIDADGTKSQRAMSIEEFTEQVGKGDLEISAQKHDEINSNVTGPFGFADNENNQMLGTFDIGFSDDESVDTIGYQTLDDESWLVENYGSNMDLEALKAQGVDVSAAEAAQAVQGTDMTQVEEFLRKYQDEVMPQLRGEIDNVFAQLGITGDSLQIYNDLAEANAKVEGQKISDELAAKEQEALEAQQAEEEAQAADETEVADDTEVADETLETPEATDVPDEVDSDELVEELIEDEQ